MGAGWVGFAVPLASLALFAAAGGTAGCSEQPRVRVYAPEEVPEDLRPALAQADRAIGALQAALLEALTAELERGGPERAVRVCRDAAQGIASKVREAEGIGLGRTSHRLRNPRNAPPAWAREVVEAHAGMRAGEAAARVFDLGDRVGVLRPIPMVGFCAACHGPPETIAPEVQAVLSGAYPEDRAVGFAPGDLRGWFWAEVPKAQAR